jgi:myosin-5
MPRCAAPGPLCSAAAALRTGLAAGRQAGLSHRLLALAVAARPLQVEAKYPALLFKQQLDAFVQKIFPMLRDNVKREITPQLAACIHAPRQPGARGARRTTSGAAAAAAAASAEAQPGTPGTPGTSRGSAAGASADGGLSPHWGNILRVFDTLLATLRESHVPPFLVQKLFEQLLSFVNVQLFNQLLLRRECCSFSNGEYVKAGLSEVEQWIAGAGEEWVRRCAGGGGGRGVGGETCWAALRGMAVRRRSTHSRSRDRSRPSGWGLPQLDGLASCPFT